MTDFDLNDIKLTDKSHVNFYNISLLDGFIRHLCKRTENEHIHTWLRSIYRNWLRTNPAFQRKVVEPSPGLTTLLTELAKTSQKPLPVPGHLILVEKMPTQDWALRAVETSSLYMWVARPLDGAASWFQGHTHLVDYLMTTDWTSRIPDNVETVYAKIQKWNEYLENQTLMQNLRVGVELRYEFEDNEHYLVKLVEASAYAAEGAIMRHCVAGYHGRDNTEIFSLRKKGVGIPLATVELEEYIPKSGKPRRQPGIARLALELRDRMRQTPMHRLGQIERRFRKKPLDEEIALLDLWFFETYGIRGEATRAVAYDDDVDEFGDIVGPRGMRGDDEPYEPGEEGEEEDDDDPDDEEPEDDEDPSDEDSDDGDDWGNDTIHHGSLLPEQETGTEVRRTVIGFLANLRSRA